MQEVVQFLVSFFLHFGNSWGVKTINADIKGDGIGKVLHTEIMFGNFLFI